MAYTVPETLASIDGRVTPGERKVFVALRDHLPEDYLVYYDIPVDDRHPDFIIVGPDLGLVIYASLGTADTVIATAAAHHRLVWIHPFLDGNGRVARLLSHAMLLATLHTGAVWSIPRGLARNVQAYKGHLAACDQTRRNDLDGRGHLSEENLAEFTEFFLGTCIDQVAFMESLIQPEALRARILRWAEEEIRLKRLPPKSREILQAILYRGELPRADVPGIVGTGERHTRRIVSALLDQGVLVSDSTRAPLRLAFPAALAARWMPGLFPERAG